MKRMKKNNDVRAQKLDRLLRESAFAHRTVPLWVLMSVTGMLLAGELVAGELPLSTPTMPTAPSALLLGESSVAQKPTRDGVPSEEITRGSAGASRGWWGTDVWHDPDRPFLYYGMEKEKPKAVDDVKVTVEGEAPSQEKEKDSTREEKRVVVVVPEGKTPEKDAEKRLEQAPFHSGKEVNLARQKSTEKEKFILSSKTESTPNEGSQAKVGYRELESITTIAELKKEREARLEIAIMNPTAENMVRYQEVNAYMLGLAHRFASAWEKARFANPEYDWTATHSPSNFARAEMSEVKRTQTTQVMQALAQVSALILVVDPTDPMAPLMAKTVKGLADTHHFEVLVIVKRPRELSRMAALRLLDDKALSAYLSNLSPIKLDTGHAERLGLKTLPALLLLPNKEAGKVFPGLTEASGTSLGNGAFPANSSSAARPLLVATGVVSVAECERRLVSLLRTNPTPRDNDPAMVPMNERVAEIALKVQAKEEAKEQAQKRAEESVSASQPSKNEKTEVKTQTKTTKESNKEGNKESAK